MAKNKKHTPPTKSTGRKITKTAGLTWLDKLENWLKEKEKIIFITLLSLAALFSLLLFNARVSEANDDSMYIEAGYKYSKDFFGYYFTANAPFYPMVLGIVIKISGLNLMLLKFSSVLFNILHLLFFYKAFKNRIPDIILFPVFFITAVNSYFLYFASQTYTEALYLFLQSVLFFLFFKLTDTIDQNDENKMTLYKQWLAIGFIMFVLTFTKNMAIMVIPAMILFFILYKKYWHAVFSVVSFILFKIPFELVKKLTWGDVGQYGSQTNVFLLKNPYNPAEGKEDISGFVSRFFDNFTLYLFKRFFQILGFLNEQATYEMGGFAFIVFVLILIGALFFFKHKNKHMVFSSIYCIFLIGLTFIILQRRWDQPRIIMIFIPLILIHILYGIYFLFKKSSVGRSLFLILIILVMSSSFISSIRKSYKNIPIVTQNLKGDLYYGYTPDWVNYLRLSTWCSENLPPEALVACRKAPMSFVYGKGRPFYPVYKVFSSDADTILNHFKKNKVTHLILANLRMDPNKNTGNIINTIHRLVGTIEEKYKGKFTLIRQEGDVESAALYKINY